MNLVLLKNKTTPCDPYEELITKHGFKPQFIPLLNHSHLDKLEIVEYLISPSFVEETHAFIITSQRAVECFNECMDLILDSSIKHKIFKKLGYTVGPATSEILSNSGFQNIRGGLDAGNGSILSDIIIQDLDPKEHKLIFFTGEIRKDIIPRKLIGNDFQLSEKVLYRTENRSDIVDNFESCCKKLQNLQQSQNDGPHWLIFFSPQGTEIFVEYLVSKNYDDDGIKFKVASIGPTTEQYLLQRGVEPDVVALKPTAKSLLDLIINH